MTLETIVPLSDDQPSDHGYRQLTGPALPTNAVTRRQLHHARGRDLRQLAAVISFRCAHGRSAD